MPAQFHWRAYCFQIRSLVTGPFPTDHPDGERADEFKALWVICDLQFTISDLVGWPFRAGETML